MVHAIGREPVQLIDLHLHVLDSPAADVFKTQGFGALGAFIAHRTNQPGTSFAGQRKHREKIRFIEIHVQFAIERRPTALHVGHVENLLISAAGESGVQGFAHDRPGTVATGQVAGLADFQLAIGQAQAGGDAVAGFLETLQLGSAFDPDAKGFQAFYQQPFMLVLGIDFEECVGCQALANRAQRQARHGFALDPEVRRSDSMTVLHHGLAEVELAIQLQRPRLHRQRPRRGAGARRLVDDPHADSQFAQPQRQYQSGRAGTDDQDVATVHGPVLLDVWSKYGSVRAWGQAGCPMEAPHRSAPAGLCQWKEQCIVRAVIACAMPLIVWLTRLNGFDGASCKPID
ncbi:hypothetical protein D3C87_1324980 [compost metagenome]